MDKKIDAERLLRALGDVDDKYIEEAMVDTSARKAAVTPLRRYSGIIAAVAAALLLIVGGSVLMKYMNSSRSTEAESAHENATVAADTQNVSMVRSNTANEEMSADSYYYDGEVPGAAQETCSAISGGELLEDDIFARDSATYDNLQIVYMSLEDLNDVLTFDFDVPVTVGESVSCLYLNHVYESGSNIAEVQYLDEDGNVICTIRKAQGSRNISGCEECYSVEQRVDVDGVGTVILSGNNRGFEVAFWTNGGYTFSVTTENPISEEAMLEIVSQVS